MIYMLVLRSTMMKKVLSKNKSSESAKGTDGISTFSLLFRFLFLFFAIILIISVIPMKVLLASDMITGDYLRSWRIGSDNRFTIKYIHSVERTPVWEVYTIDSGEIVLRETIFQSFGAGLPSTSPYDFEVVEEGFRLFNIDQKMTNLIYRTGAVRANHQLIIGDKIYPFVEFSQPTEGVRFESKKISILSYIAKEGL